jgi:hypothetical protein
MSISALSIGASLISALPPALLPTTPSGTLVLGDFVFQDYEIPTKITWGDQQKTHVFSYPGGLRNIESLGSEPLPIRWDGRFQGATAMTRARRLDVLCRSGQSLPLTWGSLSFQVLVTQFKVNQERDWQLPYSIECLVVAAPIGLPSGSLTAAPATVVLGDAETAVGLGSSVNSPTLTAALSVVQQAASAVQVCVTSVASGAGSLGQSTGQLQSALRVASGLAGPVAASADSEIAAIISGGLAGVVSGAVGPANASALLATVSALQQANAARLIQGLLGRMTKNLKEVTS